MTVTEPFHTFSLAAEQIQDTPAEHRRHMKQRAEQTLAAAHAIAQAADVVHTVVHAEDDQPHRAIVRTAAESRLRPDRDGVSRTAGRLGPRPWKRKIGPGSHRYHVFRPRLPPGAECHDPRAKVSARKRTSCRVVTAVSRPARHRNGAAWHRPLRAQAGA